MSSMDLTSLIPVGKVKSDEKESSLTMTVTRAIHDVGYNIRRDRITSYMSLPGKYRLPLKIDLCVKTDMPEIILLVGEGHITFGSPWMENRRIEDIAEPSGKPKMYDNSIPLNEFADITVIYGLKEMQITINGEERYYSKRERYMKSESFREQNISGFNIGITCTKRAETTIRSLSAEEYSGPVIRGIVTERELPFIEEAQKPTFASCIEALDIKDEVIKVDAFLKSLDNLKFKRVIEKHGNKITYVESGRGVSYALYLSGNIMHHSIQWYIITNSPPEQWHRKANPLESLLNEMSVESPELADRIFYYLNECIGCRERCMAKTPYEFKSQKKVTCHGHIFFKMIFQDFQDVRDFFAFLNNTPANPS